MTPRPPGKRGKAIQWTDEDLDRMAEIHVTEDTPLMLEFVRRYGSPRLMALLTAAPPPDDAEDEDANA